MNIYLAAVLTKFQNIPPGAFIKLDISIEGGSFGIFVEDGHGNQGIGAPRPHTTPNCVASAGRNIAPNTYPLSARF